MKTFLLILCLPAIIYAANACESSTFKNVRAVFSHKSGVNPIDVIVNDCLERTDAIKNYPIVEIINQNVEKLNRGAFINLTVNTLILNNNRIGDIEKHTFLNMRSTQKLDLSKNRLRALFRDVFNEMVSLKTLDLSSNRIEQIEDETFAHLVSLEELNLNFNVLKVWNPNWFTNNIALNKLEVEGNLLEVLPANSFRDMGKMNNLILRNNNLREIHQDAFKGLTSLKHLDLSVNKLMKLHQDTFAPFSGAISEAERTDIFNVFSHRGYNPFVGLWDLSIHTNNLTYFPEKAMQDLVNSRSMHSFTFHSNPWQCACYLKIINWADKRRLRLNDMGKGCYRKDNPVCIVPTKSPLECVEDIEEDIRTLYYSRFQVPINDFFDRNVVCNMF